MTGRGETMDQNEALVREFYAAFQRKDAAAMAACYHPEVRFSDPVFTDLRGSNAGAMWGMLVERGKDLRVELGDVRAEGDTVRAHWDATYTFSATGRKVRNSIDATFEFADGKIVRHTDSFDLRAWAGQALGLPGKLFGGTGFLQRKIRLTALKGLESHQRRAAG